MTLQRDELADRVKDRAALSGVLCVTGAAVALIPFAGTLLMLLVGWIPLLAWLMGGIDPYFETVRLRRRDLRLLAGFSLVAPIAVYGLHVWIASQGP